MTLQEYLEKENLGEEEFADEVGISRVTVNRLRRGKMIPRRDLMLRIYEATSGKVLPNDFYGLYPPARRPIRRVA